MAAFGYNIDAGREAAQILKMKELAAAEICAFCEAHFKEFHDHPIEFASDHWLVSRNDYPYKHTSLHLLLIPRLHVRTLAEMPEAMRIDFMAVLLQVESRWQLTSYAVGMRVGDPHGNGGSVDHLHAHVVVGAIDEPDHEPVRFKMSSKSKA